MRKLLFISIILLASCTVNETCREKTFGDYTWVQDSGSLSMGSIMLDEYDSILFISAGQKRHYQFNSNCNELTITPMSNNPWIVEKWSGQNIKISSGSNIVYFHKQ